MGDGVRSTEDSVAVKELDVSKADGAANESGNALLEVTSACAALDGERGKADCEWNREAVLVKNVPTIEDVETWLLSLANTDALGEGVEDI